MKITLSKGNTKIGNIVSFSLPAITTCPGRTPWCEKKCYAHRLEKRYPNVRNSYASNLEASKQEDFVEKMNESLAKIKTNTVRLHVSGDFYSIEYIENWIKIIKANPDIQFYTYTKSWRIPDLLPYIVTLAQVENLVVFASTDDDTKGETIPKGMREAYAGDNKPDKFLFCLEQAGKADSCESCKMCFKRNVTSDIYFKTH